MLAVAAAAALAPAVALGPATAVALGPATTVAHGPATTVAHGPATTVAHVPRASLTDIEQDVMCVSCHEPLALAQSPQADAERAYISMRIAQGETKAQIERDLVAQYGPSVLGKPPAHGFNLTVYILPPALLIAGALMLILVLPRWRRRTRERADANPLRAAPRLDAADARRLQEDLARFD
jgi:cytochrome c-type biogenesis protein CcmH